MLRIILLLLALIIIALSLRNWYFEQYYKKDVRLNLSRVSKLQDELLTENDIQHLPPPVQQYLRYAGVLNKPQVHSVKIVFEGQMRGRDKDWFPFVSEQYNFFDVPTRLFFMKGKMFGINVPGYHAYKNGDASMQIKLFGWFPVVNIKGGDLNKTETVTLFNDMCLLAPATLIDKKFSGRLLTVLLPKLFTPITALPLAPLCFLTNWAGCPILYPTTAALSTMGKLTGFQPRCTNINP
ncbi:MAG: hypothetical protein IPN33_25145 [Saprospiraceae bacterium]|nr:hypothetical protein [Saprospiraceae bacterium]